MLKNTIFINLYELEVLIKNIKASFPKEASGIILINTVTNYLSFVKTDNSENTLLSFVIREKEILETEDKFKNTIYKIAGCYHSHILGDAYPSRKDILATKKTGDLWLIYSYSLNNLNIFEWSGKSFRKKYCKISLR